MKKYIIAVLLCSIAMVSKAQEQIKVERACLDYIEGFYEGDSTKLIKCLKPTLYKIGYWKAAKSDQYVFDGQMTYRQAIDYANRVASKNNFAKPGSPKKVEILSIMNTIASAKVTAWWGVDFVLLSKQGDKWMIEQVLWEGPAN